MPEENDSNEISAEEDSVPYWVFGIAEKSADEINVFERVNQLKYTDPDTVVKVYKLGRILSKVFADHGLKYWTSGGTTLGICRHSGLIPWDDDLDICIMEDQVNLLKNTITEDLNLVHDIVVVEAKSIGFRIFHKTASSELHRSDDLKLDYRYPFCDVFVMARMPHNRNKCHIADRTGRVIWPRETYSVDDVLEKAKNRQFGDFTLRCPGNAESYLDRTYGQNWKSIGETQSYCHLNQESMASVGFDLKDFKPALPFR